MGTTDNASQTLFCWIWGLTAIRSCQVGSSFCVTNLILLDLRSDQKMAPRNGRQARHVTNLILLDLRSDQWEEQESKPWNKCHKPYFVGFEVWHIMDGKDRIRSHVTNLILLDLRSDHYVIVSAKGIVGVSQTLFCWIWGLTKKLWVKAPTNVMSQTLFCWIWGLTERPWHFFGNGWKCHKPYFVGFEVWPSQIVNEGIKNDDVTNLILLDLRSDP